MGAYKCHMCMGVCISVFAPYLCNTSVSGLDEYADGSLFEKGADWYPFCPGGGTGRVFLGGGSGGATPKIGHDVQIVLLTPPDLDHIFLRPYDTVFYCTVPYIRSENENTANRHITGRNAFVSVHHAVCTQARNEKIQSLNSNASLCEEHNLII